MSPAREYVISSLIEGYVKRWLRENKLGRAVLTEFPFDEAVDHVFELLNAGFLKITSDEEGFTGIDIRNPPEPPLRSVRRARGPFNDGI